MSRRQSDNEEDALSLSFLDVLCCGLGATIYLFLLFSILPHLGSGRDASEKMPGGAKSTAGALEEEGDHVLIAPVLIQVTFPPMLDVSESDLEWAGFPEQFVQSVIPRSNENPCMAVAFVPSGFNPAKHGGRARVVLSMKPGILSRIAAANVTVRAHVGGGRQEIDTKISTPAKGNDMMPVLEFDFLDPNKQWIHLSSK